MTDPSLEPQTPAKLDEQALRARGRRNLAIAGALLLFVVLVFVVTLVRMGGAGAAPHY